MELENNEKEIPETTNSEVENNSSENSTQNETVDNKKPLPKGIFDFNLSILSLLLTIGFIALLGFINGQYIGPVLLVDVSSYNGILFNVLTFVFGAGLSAIFYNLGRYLVAKLRKYRVSYFECFGVSFTRINDKVVTKFKIGEIFDFHLRLMPPSVDTDPALNLFVGHAFNILFAALISVCGYFLASANLGCIATISGTGFVYAAIFGLCINFYELLPFRGDYDNDMFTFIKTRGQENKQAYNMILLNEYNDISNQNFVIVNFEGNNYNSYYKAQSLYYNYFQYLYEDNLEQAINTLNLMLYYKKYLPVEVEYAINAEKIYFFLLLGENEKAEKYYLSLKRDNKNAINDVKSLNSYHVAILVAGLILHTEEECVRLIDEFNTQELDSSVLRIRKEIQFFTTSVEKVKEVHSEYILPEVKQFN